MQLFDLLNKELDHNESLQWTGTLEEYLQLVVERPYLAQRAHSRIYNMLTSYGIETQEDKITHYKFWDNEIFGLEKEKEALVDYFRAAAQGMEVGRRILLLMGPPASGKSSMVTLLKKRLAEWTKTDEGAVYAIDGCPMHEDPLHLLPEAVKDSLRKEYGIVVDGDLCPYCRWRLNAPESEGGFGGDPRKAKIKRVVFSESERMGIGSFSPSDIKAQDVSELIGSMNLATIGEYGTESDPRAYRFDGELHVANRGICEFIEILKVDPRFLYILLTLAQEKVIKVPRYPLMYVDEVVISHTNESEYNTFKADSKNEALLDRMHVIVIPYNLKVSDEEKIYERLLMEGNYQNVHIAPHTVHIAALFGILSRLDPKADEKLSLVDKAKLYDGQLFEGWTSHQVKELQAKSPREGMGGLSPRFIIDGISKAIGRPDVKCVTPMGAMKGLLEHLDHHPAINSNEKENLKNLLAMARKEYDDIITKQVSHAFVHAFDEQAKAIVDRYLAEVAAWKNKDKLEDPITGEHRDPDEKFMRGVEEFVGVSEPASKEFREEILWRVGQMALKGQKFQWDSHSRLKDGVEKKLFADVKNIMKAIVNTSNPDEEQQKKIDDVIEALKAEGYCDHCAKEVLKYTGSKLDV